jgi:hypothetical protein
MSKEKQYRIVSDFGWGDKSWQERFIAEEDALELINKTCNMSFETIDQAMDGETYYLEIDHPDDEEDWDWMDS